MINDKITKNMTIDEVLKKYPQTAEIFLKYGFHCLGCAAATFETLEQGATAHGITAEELLEDLNKTIGA
ncbi:MAG: disulfide oxidoreductase [Candidatus Portnoybacteria bacterium RBG_13_40_8]|uniref:Disulfide oxidoreductase n=1 Tax=Candidatus Portnoybacteria bacterium RBG_13_40_8 TaxID=1801990 RepID=A0A1G2F5N1_9BACT|nr:MAG: disulfide oxidoreductase [Candidatus Portnoybacteria bacterium RBG_13_40_8]OGZ34684.1 MAG: disulfide oxidoreductase [Candidatus Portnoybacteria bacterium RIFCSPHIGHO2_01_FULL_39_19]